MPWVNCFPGVNRSEINPGLTPGLKALKAVLVPPPPPLLSPKVSLPLASIYPLIPLSSIFRHLHHPLSPSAPIRSLLSPRIHRFSIAFFRGLLASVAVLHATHRTTLNCGVAYSRGIVASADIFREQCENWMKNILQLVDKKREPQSKYKSLPDTFIHGPAIVC